MATHRCEALVSQQSQGKRYYRVMFVPCGKEGAELHHKLTRARGGLILDAVGESYHHCSCVGSIMESHTTRAARSRAGC